MRLLFCFLLVHLTYAAVAQADKSVVLTVVGQGANADEARKVALRSSIEQAFGAFVSSKTEVLNDQVSSDEIVTISNGNVQQYEVISESALPDGTYAMTIRSTVSVSKLTSFCESKGIAAELKGSLFAANVQQKNLNAESELKAIQNLCNILRNVLNKSFDFNVEISEPSQSKNSANAAVGSEQYDVPVKISVAANNNMKVFADMLTNSLAGISMKPSEVADFKQIKKPYYTLFIGDKSKFGQIGFSKTLLSIFDGKVVVDKKELATINPESGKRFWIGLNLIGGDSRLDTLVMSFSDIKSEIGKVKNELADLKDFIENSRRVTRNDFIENWRSATLFWTFGDYRPPIFYLRNVESLKLLNLLFARDLPTLLFDYEVTNEVRIHDASAYANFGRESTANNSRDERINFSLRDRLINFSLRTESFSLGPLPKLDGVNSKREPQFIEFINESYYKWGIFSNVSGLEVNRFFNAKIIVDFMARGNRKPYYDNEVDPDFAGMLDYVGRLDYPLPEYLMLWRIMHPELRISRQLVRDPYVQVATQYHMADYYDQFVSLDRLLDPKPLFTISYTDRYSIEDLKKVTKYEIKKRVPMVIDGESQPVSFWIAQLASLVKLCDESKEIFRFSSEVISVLTKISRGSFMGAAKEEVDKQLHRLTDSYCYKELGDYHPREQLEIAGLINAIKSNYK